MIDGQQRLTTIFVLLAAIRDKIKIDDEDHGEGFHNTWIINQYQIGDDRLKLLPTKWDQQSFMSVIEPHQYDSLLGTVYNPRSKIILAYNYFKTCLGDKPDLDIKNLRDSITSRFKVISILLGFDDDQYRIFETLNSAGLRLSQADLIRNYLFMKVRKEDQESFYEKFWQLMQKIVGEIYMDQFFRHFLMKNGFNVNEKEVFDTVHKLSSDMNVHEYLQDLLNHAQIYAKLLEPDRYEKDEAILNMLERLNSIKATTAYPFLLRIYYDYSQGQNLDKQQFLAVLKLIENFLIRRFVRIRRDVGRLFSGFTIAIPIIPVL